MPASPSNTWDKFCTNGYASKPIDSWKNLKCKKRIYHQIFYLFGLFWQYIDFVLNTNSFRSSAHRHHCLIDCSFLPPSQHSSIVQELLQSLHYALKGNWVAKAPWMSPGTQSCSLSSFSLEGTYYSVLMTCNLAEFPLDKKWPLEY